MKDIKTITLEVKFEDNSEKMIGFIRPKKIKELLSDDGSLGDFLRDFIKD